MAIDSYQKRARRALRQTIKHWTLDIIRRLKTDDIVGGVWASDWTRVPCNAHACALCHSFECSLCPLCALYPSCPTIESAWDNFVRHYTLASAEKMRDQLIEVYKFFGGRSGV